jgi:hypothetical protein
MGYASPAIVQTMREWVNLGGGNSGIVGDATHSFGFHVPANQLPASDYSISRDPYGGPINWDFACAGDFSHRGDPRLRAYFVGILNRLLAGDPSLSMICEFIGQPWANRPVLYWFRGDGLQNYTGQGHDTWTHLSWWRSRANLKAPLWAAATPLPPKDEDEDMIFLVGIAGKPAKFASDNMQTVRWIPSQAALDNYKAQGKAGTVKVWQSGSIPIDEPDRATLQAKWGTLVGPPPPEDTW